MQENGQENNFSSENSAKEDLSNLSIEQINQMFDDIVNFSDDYFLAAAATASKHCHNARC